MHFWRIYRDLSFYRTKCPAHKAMYTMLNEYFCKLSLEVQYKFHSESLHLFFLNIYSVAL